MKRRSTGITATEAERGVEMSLFGWLKAVFVLSACCAVALVSGCQTLCARDPFAPRKMSGTWVSLGTSITWYNDNLKGMAGRGLSRGYQDRVRDVLAFDGFLNLGCNGGTVGTQLGNVKAGDYYTIEHGINDWGHSVPVGTIADYRNPGAKNGTFCATYRKLVDKIRALNPQAKIILCTPRRGYGFHGYLPARCEEPKNGIYLREYADAVRAIAAEEGFPLVDFYATCGEQDELASLSIDVALHPNDAGFERMAHELLKAFATVE